MFCSLGHRADSDQHCLQFKEWTRESLASSQVRPVNASAEVHILQWHPDDAMRAHTSALPADEDHLWTKHHREKQRQQVWTTDKLATTAMLVQGTSSHSYCYALLIFCHGTGTGQACNRLPLDCV